MSYSFNIRAASAAAALVLVRAELDKVVAFQRCHKQDRDQAEAVATAYVALLPEVPASKDLQVSMHGSLSGTWLDGDLAELTGANVGMTASLVPKVPAI